MKIVITGASGFVGKNLYDFLQVSNEVRSLSIRYKANQEFDIQEDVVIHLAGKAHDLKNVLSPKDYYESNFQLTKQLFDSFLSSDASLFIFMSTVKAVADKIETVLTEDTLPNPETDYGISKRQAEEYILSKPLPVGKKFYILRPCMIHGPGNKGNLNLLYKMVSKGLPWPLGSFENKRSFLNIENLCFIIKELLDNKNIPSGIYQLSDDESISTNELIKLLGDSLGKRSDIWRLNPFFVKRFAKLGDYLGLSINSERLQKLTENYVVSNDKIKQEIKKELPFSTKEGLMKTFKSFKMKE